MNKMKFSGSAVFGIILIAIGVISLLSGLKYFDSWEIFSTYWPLVIVLFGVKSLIDHRSSTMFGVILIGVGVFLQLDLLGLWYLGDINVKELIVPVVIILIGLSFVLPKSNRQATIDREVEVVERTMPSPAAKEVPVVEEVVEVVTDTEIVVEAVQETEGINQDKVIN